VKIKNSWCKRFAAHFSKTTRSAAPPSSSLPTVRDSGCTRRRSAPPANGVASSAPAAPNTLNALPNGTAARPHASILRLELLHILCSNAIAEIGRLRTCARTAETNHVHVCVQALPCAQTDVDKLPNSASQKQRSSSHVFTSPSLPSHPKVGRPIDSKISFRLNLLATSCPAAHFSKSTRSAAPPSSSLPTVRDSGCTRRRSAPPARHRISKGQLQNDQKCDAKNDPFGLVFWDDIPIPVTPHECVTPMLTFALLPASRPCRSLQANAAEPAASIR